MNSHPSPLHDRPRLALLAVILAGFGWRMWGLTAQGLWRDEVDAIYFALRPLPQTLSMFIEPAQNGPLYFLALRPWFTWLGSQEFMLRYPSALAGALSIALIWRVGRILWTEERSSQQLLEPALVAALLLAVNPYQRWYGQEGKMYAVLICLVLAAHWAWLTGMQRGGWRPWVLYVLLTTISFFTHLLAVLLIPLHLIWFALSWLPTRRQFQGYGAALVALTAPYSIMAWWHWAMITRVDFTTPFTFTPLSTMVRILILNHSRGFVTNLNPGWLLPVFALALAGILLAPWLPTSPGPNYAQRPFRPWLLTLAWLAAPVLLIYAISLIKPVFLDRYVIWIAPAALLMMAVGVARMRTYSLPLTLLLLSWVVGIWLYAGWLQPQMVRKSDLRQAVAFVTANRQPEQLLILHIPYLETSYRYYSSDFGPRPFDNSDQRLLPWAPGLWTNNDLVGQRAESEVDRNMRETVGAYTQVWLVRSESELWDQRGLTEAWLTSHGTLQIDQEFDRVSVQLFRLNPESDP